MACGVYFYVGVQFYYIMSGNRKSVIENEDKFIDKQAVAIVRQCFSINKLVSARLLQSINELLLSVSEKLRLYINLGFTVCFTAKLVCRNTGKCSDISAQIIEEMEFTNLALAILLSIRVAVYSVILVGLFTVGKNE